MHQTDPRLDSYVKLDSESRVLITVILDAQSGNLSSESFFQATIIVNLHARGHPQMVV
jgi:flagellar assembly factor FliW